MSFIDFSELEMDARLEGSQIFTATADSITEHMFMFDFNCKFNGLDFYAWDSHVGDNVKLEIKYEAAPGVWYRYKKFGKNWLVFPNVKDRIILFPSSPSMGLKVFVSYENKGLTDIKFGVNFYQFVDSETVNPMVGEQGEDW